MDRKPALPVTVTTATAPIYDDEFAPGFSAAVVFRAIRQVRKAEKFVPSPAQFPEACKQQKRSFGEMHTHAPSARPNTHRRAPIYFFENRPSCQAALAPLTLPFWARTAQGSLASLTKRAWSFCLRRRSHARQPYAQKLLGGRAGLRLSNPEEMFLRMRNCA